MRLGVSQTVIGEEARRGGAGSGGITGAEVAEAGRLARRVNLLSGYEDHQVLANVRLGIAAEEATDVTREQ